MIVDLFKLLVILFTLAMGHKKKKIEKSKPSISARSTT